MTDEQAIEIDELLQQKGWRYNAETERFETLATADADAKLVGWAEVLVAFPHLCLNNLEEYQDQKWRPLEKQMRDELVKKYGDKAEWRTKSKD